MTDSYNIVAETPAGFVSLCVDPLYCRLIIFYPTNVVLKEELITKALGYTFADGKENLAPNYGKYYSDVIGMTGRIWITENQYYRAETFSVIQRGKNLEFEAEYPNYQTISVYPYNQYHNGGENASIATPEVVESAIPNFLSLFVAIVKDLGGVSAINYDCTTKQFYVPADLEKKCVGTKVVTKKRKGIKTYYADLKIFSNEIMLVSPGKKIDLGRERLNYETIIRKQVGKSFNATELKKFIQVMNIFKSNI